MKKKMGKIENWSIQIVRQDEYKAPEQGRSAVVGSIYNDMRAVDGTPITTSRLVNLDVENSTLETNNSIYDLGVMDSGFENYMMDNGYTLDQYVEGINGN